MSTSELMVSYRIDQVDRLTETSGDWMRTDPPGLPDETGPQFAPPVGRPLWDYIVDDNVRSIYKAILRRVRLDQSPMLIQFRCDLPQARRFLELTIRPLAMDGISFSSRVKRVEPRPAVLMLDDRRERSEEFIAMCSWCNRAKTLDGIWLEMEEVIELDGWFMHSRLPRLSHGMCPQCYRELTDKYVA